MNLIRLLVIALIVYLVIQIFKRWAANKKLQSGARQKIQEEQKMVRCDVCQLHIPEKEALQHDGKFYCSQEHLNHKQD